MLDVAGEVSSSSAAHDRERQPRLASFEALARLPDASPDTARSARQGILALYAA